MLFSLERLNRMQNGSHFAFLQKKFWAKLAHPTHMHLVLLHLLYLALVDFFFFDLSFFSGTVCLRHRCPALIRFIAGHNETYDRRSDLTKLIYRTFISMPNFIVQGMHAVSLLKMILPRYTLKNTQFVVFCSVTRGGGGGRPRELITSRTGDTVSG
jgi:hypothetical protein